VMRALAGPSRRKRTPPAAEPGEPAAPPGPGAADDRQDDDADGEIPQDVRDRLLSKGWPADDIAEMTVAEAIAVDGDNTRKLADGSMLRGGSGDGTPPPGPPPPPPPDPFERCDWRLFTTDAEGNEKLRAEQWCQRATWTQIKEGVEQRAPKLPPGWFYSAFVMVDGVEQFACVWPAIGMNTGDPGDFLKPSSLEPGIDQPEAFRDYHFPDYAARRVGWQVLSDDEFKVMWLTVLADRFPRVRCIRDEGEAAPPVVPEDASVVPEQPSDAASPAPPSAPKKKWYAIWNKATGKWTGHGRPRTFGTKAIAKSEMRNVMYEDKLTGMKIKDLEVRLYEQEPA